MSGYKDTLCLIARRERRPTRSLPALDQLFGRLAASSNEGAATAAEDRIWDLWMYHPHRAAADMLDRATSDIAAGRHDIAETRLVTLLRRRPDFPEAWHKRAALYYLLERDDECICDLHRTLELEPRHFAAMCSFAEILLDRGARDDALFAFSSALILHPRLERAKKVIAGL